MVYYVLDRDVGRIRLFRVDEDYAACERVIAETLPLVSTRYKPKGS